MRDWAARAAARRPHAFVAAVPGGTPVRLGVEVELGRRGWPLALAPADTDVLVVCGSPSAAASDPLERLWQSVPRPRTRLEIHVPEAVSAALDTAPARLTDVVAQRRTADRVAVERGDGPGDGERATQQDSHSHGDGMDMPGELPMADRAEDRDGLKLDQLHVRLGPFLPDWPAGLVLSVAMQGDVLQDVVVESRTSGAPSYWQLPWARAAAGEAVTVGEGARHRLAADADTLVRFLGVAGWPDAAMAARRLRDAALAGTGSDQLRRPAHRFVQQVARSRTLAWSTRGLGAGDTATDVTARYRRRLRSLDVATSLLDDNRRLDPEVLAPPLAQAEADLAGLPALLTGAELAATRLIVASLELDGDQLSVPAPEVLGHG